MLQAAALVVASSARSPATDAAAAVRELAFGAAAVVLLLACVAAAVAGALGGRWVAVAAALDPALPGSLPDLCGLLLLSTALLAFVSPGRRAAGFAHPRVAALTPLALLLADSTSAAAHLAAFLGGKPIANAAIGAVALAPALGLRLGVSPAGRRLGRSLVVRLLAWGSTAVALDLLGSAIEKQAPGAAAGHVVAMAEEVLELILYCTVSAALAVDWLRAEVAETGMSHPGT